MHTLIGWKSVLYESIKGGDKAVTLSDTLSDNTVNVHSWALGLYKFLRVFRRAYKMGEDLYPVGLITSGIVWFTGR